MRVSGTVKIIKDAYRGNAKAGPYLSMDVEVQDGNYSFWLPLYVVGQSFAQLEHAAVGETYEITGTLTQNSRKVGDKTVRTIQVKVESAKRLGKTATPGSVYIEDSDIPF